MIVQVIGWLDQHLDEARIDFNGRVLITPILSLECFEKFDSREILDILLLSSLR